MMLDIYRTGRGQGPCRGCGASILWAIVVKSGARMPFNEIVPVDTRVDDRGRTIDTVDTLVSVTHFATCPKRRQFKRDPKRRG